MKEILSNLAMLDLLQFCEQNAIDPSGTHVYKYPRAQRYALVRDVDGRALVTVSFYKNQVPHHSLPHD